MTDQVIYAPEAASDVEQAYDWYERRKMSIGKDHFDLR